jgi:hypothetical protein
MSDDAEARKRLLAEIEEGEGGEFSFTVAGGDTLEEFKARNAHMAHPERIYALIEHVITKQPALFDPPPEQSTWLEQQVDAERQKKEDSLRPQLRIPLDAFRTKDPIQRASDVFDLVSIVLHPRDAAEIFGDALEELDRRKKLNTPNWLLYVRVAMFILYATAASIQRLSPFISKGSSAD